MSVAICRTGAGCSRLVCNATQGTLTATSYDLFMTTSDLGMPPVLDPGAAAGRSVLRAAPRGYCAGVDRAVITVEKALDLYGAPVYVRKQIVHNRHVVARLEARGAVFVEELDEVPTGATVVFSAHGVSPAVHQQAEERNL